MEFVWDDTPVLPKDLLKREVEESFEDPFSIRMLPDFERGVRESRFFNLGRTVANKCVFSVFWTDGKRYRVIAAREATELEAGFYDRKNAENAN